MNHRQFWDPRIPNPLDFGLLDDDLWRVPFGDPETYGDWWHTSLPYDDRDLLNDHDRNWWTGLPPRNHQGFEYQWGETRDTNGDGGDGRFYRPVRPMPPRHDGRPHRKAFVWPSDGKRKSTWGRWKDIGSGKGPDIFVTHHGHQPTRNHWKNRHQDFNVGESWEDSHRAMPWAKRGLGDHYNFYTRDYQKDKPGRYTWADAVWPRHDADQHDFPLSFRCKHDDWFNMRWAPFGGVPLPEHSYHRRRKDRKGLWK